MKKFRSMVALLAGVALAGCAQLNPVPRELVEANLTPMLKVEKRADRVKYYAEMLLGMDGMSRESAQKLKATYDVYYVYYMAASVHLAGGNLESYLAHVKLAEKELDAMEGILKRDLAKLTELEKQRKQRLFQSGL